MWGHLSVTIDSPSSTLTPRDCPRSANPGSGTELPVPDIVEVWDQTTCLTQNCGNGRRCTIRALSVTCSTVMRRRVYNHCFRRTADWSLAEDLTSVVFLEAWRRRKQVRMHEDSVLPWLLAVANNCLRNAERSRRRYKRLLAKLPVPDDAADLALETSERLDDAESMRRILVVVHTLSREDQEVIALCDWSGLTYEEAATALAVPIGTVKSATVPRTDDCVH